MSTGFIITELQLLSTKAQPATVSFSRGLNVITGPSNTGKTYIFQCINYMLGSSAKPKAILESIEYDTVNLKILTNDDEKYTLQSDLKGGDFIVTSSSGEPKKYARKHSADNDDNISVFYLSLNALAGKKIRTNANGKTRKISYRDLVKFLLVDETKIITDRSPILSGQYTSGTEEKSVFKLILSGQDDSAIIEGMTKDQVKHRKGKIEMLTELISSTSVELNRLADSVEPEERLKKVESRIKGLETEHAQLKNVFTELDTQRNSISSTLSEFLNKKLYNDELLKRSTILNQQYETDAKRLNSTIEASYLLQNNPTIEQHCPVCDNLIGTKNIELELPTVIRSCQLEIIKVENLIKEVVASQAILNEENSEFQSEIGNLQEQLNQISEQIESGVATQMQGIFDQIAELNGLRAKLDHAIFLKEKIASFEAQKELISSSLVKEERGNILNGILTSSMFDLCNSLNAILVACNYPDIKGVSFSETKEDFVISGQDRELFGKGYRAIIYAAFLVSLQELISNKAYSLGPTIIDSPLVTYKKPTAQGEEIPIDLAMNFYRYLSTDEKVDQIIILENEEPPLDIADQISHIKFTRNDQNGRYGFIPKTQT